MLRGERLAREGFLHGFSLRAGGVSTGPFASLNLGGSVGDDPAAVEENLQRFARAAGLAAPPVTATQVHGVVVVAAAEARRAQADAVVATAAGEAVAIRTADCVPLLLAHPRSGRAAAVHAGWRGTIDGVLAAALRALAAPPAELLVAIGPAIGPCCYEVSEELAGRFRASFGAVVAPARHLDLHRCHELALAQAGVPAASIERVGGCTACDPGRFFSHRRDAGRTGRHLSFIGARPVS